MNYVNMASFNYMMQHTKCYCTILLLLPILATAQNPSDTRQVQTPVYTLQNIIQNIAGQNLQLKSFGLKAESFIKSSEAATAWMPPMVGLGTFMTPYPAQKVMDPSDKGNLMLRIEQDIPNRTKLQAAKRYIASQAKIANAGRAISLNDLRTRAKQLYYSWFVALHRISVLQRNEAIMLTMKKIEAIRYQYNQSQLGNVYAADAKIEENRNMLRMQYGEIAKARAYLNSLMNVSDTTVFTIDTSTAIQFDAVLFDTAKLAASRGDVLQMNEGIRSMQLNIEAIQKQNKPDLKIQYDHMFPLGMGMPRQFSLMAMVSIPIAPWSARMYKAEAKAMQFNVMAMENDKAAMLQETQGMLYGMQYEIAIMQQRIQAMQRSIIPALQKSFDANYINYQENRLQLPLLITSWEALNMMQLNVLDEKLKLYQMIAGYEKELYK